jgi:hypothetical protein|tara:strand:- start:1292 stop:1495 length:204 start_codon:yes stop_codon:yes gene_type:complete
MPTVDVEQNIKETLKQLEKTSQELYRLQGVLHTFQGFARGGLKTIELPVDPSGNSIKELDSVQEKPE